MIPPLTRRPGESNDDYFTRVAAYHAERRESAFRIEEGSIAVALGLTLGALLGGWKGAAAGAALGALLAAVNASVDEPFLPFSGVFVR